MKQSIYLLLPMLCICGAAVTAQQNDRPANLASLVEAERAFARMSVEKGMRESFLAYFAESGINFGPHPARTRERFLAQTGAGAPITLEWQPVYADVSELGELGYTTGPFVVTDRSPKNLPPDHGWYFSIWKRQEDGAWKVVLDNGVSTPPPVSGEAPALATAGPGMLPKREGDVENRRKIPDKLERGLLQAARMNGFMKVFSEMTSERVRFYRNGMLPILGRDSMVAYLESRNLEMAWEPVAWDIASTWDLCYVYGTYELRRRGENPAAPENPPQEHGYYVRIWKREADGKWRIVLDAAHAIPLQDSLRGK